MAQAMAYGIKAGWLRVLVCVLALGVVQSSSRHEDCSGERASERASEQASKQAKKNKAHSLTAPSVFIYAASPLSSGL